MEGGGSETGQRQPQKFSQSTICTVPITEVQRGHAGPGVPHYFTPTISRGKEQSSFQPAQTLAMPALTTSLRGAARTGRGQGVPDKKEAFLQPQAGLASGGAWFQSAASPRKYLRGQRPLQVAPGWLRTD